MDPMRHTGALRGTRGSGFGPMMLCAVAILASVGGGARGAAAPLGSFSSGGGEPPAAAEEGDPRALVAAVI
jgi:hypothetical protein